jgi:hypothetical protein
MEMTPDELARLVNPDKHFKFTNFIEWLDNEKSERRYKLRKRIINSLTTIILFMSTLFAGHLNLINAEAMTALLGGIIGFALTGLKKKESSSR